MNLSHYKHLPSRLQMDTERRDYNQVEEEDDYDLGISNNGGKRKLKRLAKREARSDNDDNMADLQDES